MIYELLAVINGIFPDKITIRLRFTNQQLPNKKNKLKLCKLTFIGLLFWQKWNKQI